MTWVLLLVVWWMNFATLLASWMLRCGSRVSKVDLRAPGVRVLSRQGSIVRTSPAVTPSLWPPLVFQLTNTAKHSTTWFLLQSTRKTLATPGNNGAESGADELTSFTLSFQEPQSAREYVGRNFYPARRAVRPGGSTWAQPSFQQKLWIFWTHR